MNTSLPMARETSLVCCTCIRHISSASCRCEVPLLDDMESGPSTRFELITSASWSLNCQTHNSDLLSYHNELRRHPQNGTDRVPTNNERQPASSALPLSPGHHMSLRIPIRGTHARTPETRCSGYHRPACVQARRPDDNAATAPGPKPPPFLPNSAQITSTTGPEALRTERPAHQSRSRDPS